VLATCALEKRGVEGEEGEEGEGDGAAGLDGLLAGGRGLIRDYEG